MLRIVPGIVVALTSLLVVVSGLFWAVSADGAKTQSAPWAHPVSFGMLAGWRSGASGTTQGTYGGPLESAAWIAKGVRYRSPATDDPPTATLAHLPANAIIVWAGISTPFQSGRPIRLDLRSARHLACCDGPVAVVGGMDELTGFGPRRAYSVIVRVYYGSRPTTRLRAEAQQALRRLVLPAPRSR